MKQLPFFMLIVILICNILTHSSEEFQNSCYNEKIYSQEAKA